MTFASINRGAERTSCWAVVALGTSIPISTALDNILLALVLVTWIVSGQATETIKISFKNNVLLGALLLFLLLVIGTFYGDTPRREALLFLSKYSDLVFIPIFAWICRDSETRRYALHAMACSFICVLLLSLLIKFGALPKLPFITGDALSPTVFKLRLTHNILMAFGAFLFAWLAYAALTPNMKLLWRTCTALAIINVMLMVQGATGYLILALLILLYGWNRIGWSGTVFALIAVALLGTLLASVPSSFQKRTTEIEQEFRGWQPGVAASTSVGYRLEFYYNTLQIVRDHPMGVGTGGFPKAYAEQVKGTGKVETRNPHNEFLHLAVQVGIAGLLVLVWLFVQQWLIAKRIEAPLERALMRGLVLTMVVGCLLNSLLLDHTEGLFYAWLTGVLCGGLEYAPRNKSPHPA